MLVNLHQLLIMNLLLETRSQRWKLNENKLSNFLCVGSIEIKHLTVDQIRSRSDSLLPYEFDQHILFNLHIL